MALVSDAEVKQIIATAVDTTPFITSADLIVTEQLVGKGMTDARLKQIELYLAAHFVSVSASGGVGVLKKQKMGDSEDEYEVAKIDKGLGGTTFGQQALALDISGTLRSMSARTGQNAQFRIV